MKIGFLGTGAWATALANTLLINKVSVAMWGIDKKELNDLKNGYNQKYFDTPLNGKLSLVTDDMEELVNFNPDYIIAAVPSAFIKEVLRNYIAIANKPIKIINVAKGLDPETNNTWSKTIMDSFKNHINSFITLTGPSFAIDVYAKQPTVVNLVSKNVDEANKVAKLFNNHFFKCVVTNDETGAELCGALKNVMAIALGISTYYHATINTRAAMLTQATKEIASIVELYNGNKLSLLQFCGIGDIFLTCSDFKSRNYSFGNQVARLGIKNALKENIKTVEGFKTAQTIYKVIVKNKLKCPVLTNTYKVLYEDMPPENFVSNIIREIDY